MLQIVGNGKTILTVTNRGKQASLDIHVNVNDEPNEPPVADAGRNKTVKAGTKVKLSGSKSRDAEGEALYYSWSQVRGSKFRSWTWLTPKRRSKRRTSRKHGPIGSSCG